MALPLRSSADTLDSLIQQLMNQQQFNKEYGLKKQELAMDEPLKRAKAAEADMYARLIAKATGNPMPDQAINNSTNLGSTYSNPSYAPSFQDIQKIKQMQPGESYVVGEESKIPYPNQGNNSGEKNAMDWLVKLGVVKEGPMEQQQREIATAKAKEQNKYSIKNAEEMGTKYESAVEMKGTLDALEDMVTSPTFESIKQNPIYMGKDLAYYKIKGTPEQKQLIGDLESYSGEIYVDMSSKFKGAFRIGEQALVKNMKVNPEDSLDVAVGKIGSMQAINQLIMERSRIAADLIEKGVPKSIAIEMADKQINGNQIREDIKNRIELSRKQKKEEASTSGEKFSLGSKVLANKLTLPRFETQQAFESWFRNLDKTTQNAVLLKVSKGQ